MKTSEVFKRAKQHLAETFEETTFRKEKFICISITRAAYHSKRITAKDMERCEGIVNSRLEGEYVMEKWLVTQGCVPEYSLCDRNTKDRIQAHRHAWVDMLIAEFESKGD